MGPPDYTLHLWCDVVGASNNIRENLVLLSGGIRYVKVHLDDVNGERPFPTSGVPWLYNEANLEKGRQAEVRGLQLGIR